MSLQDVKTATHAVTIPVQAGNLEGDLVIPQSSRRLIVFAHGSGSSRHSPRNRFVAQQLQERGLSTLLFDLLTPEEDEIDKRTRQLRFDIGLLASRLGQAADWLKQRDDTRNMHIGYFGASTGSAAALTDAGRNGAHVKAIVSRGGRPDLTEAGLGNVDAPTLLIVGGRDEPVLDMNRKAMAQMTCTTNLEIVENATHLFEEEGALEQVVRLAGDWFDEHLT